MTGMGVSQPVRTGATQLFGTCGMVGRNGIRNLIKEAMHHIPYAGTGQAVLS
jgi:hypothetical protein